MFLARTVLICCVIWASLTLCLILASGQEVEHPTKEASLEPITQPIAFSHKIHTQELGLECVACHQKADNSRSAGLPVVSDCMACHAVISTDHPEVKKLAQYAGREEPIKWERVYRVPYWVIFSHQNHAKARIECSECHGNVSQRDVLWKEKNLSMDHCVECHRMREVSIDCKLCHELDEWLELQ